MKRLIAFLIVVMVLLAGVFAFAASPYDARFSGTLNYTNELGRDITVDHMLIASDCVNSTNVVTWSLIRVQDETMTTNASDTVTTTFSYDTATFNGATNYVFETPVVVPTGGVFRISNSSADQTNSVYFPRE